LIGLTNLRAEPRPEPPKLDRERARFVLERIDQILEWEKSVDHERDTRFVELGRYLCEVRAGQYWRLERFHSFDEFLEHRFPDSRRKAYYLMSIHEHLPPPARKLLRQIGWSKAAELVKVARRDGKNLDCATWLHKARSLPKEQFKHVGSDRSRGYCLEMICADFLAGAHMQEGGDPKFLLLALTRTYEMLQPVLQAEFRTTIQDLPNHEQTAA
jgi:hypothetical protein